MSKISRIQLRGISRTPSDRLTEDGGCAESLNVSLDHSELAPSFIPEDVTKKLGLPDDLLAEKVFLHKTPNYENCIVVSGSKVIAYLQNPGSSTILNLNEKEKVQDVASIGNTIVVATTQNIYYALFVEGKYKLLGNKVPFPYINFTKVGVDKEYSFSINRVFNMGEGFMGNWSKMWFMTDVTRVPSANMSPIVQNGDEGILPEANDWTRENFAEKQGYKVFDEDISASINEMVAEVRKDAHFYNGLFVRYSLELYDGTELSSMPIYIHSDLSEIELYSRTNVVEISDTAADFPGQYLVQNVTNTAEGSLSAFDIKAKCLNIEELKEWTDIVKQVNIYVSDSLDIAYRGYPKIKDRTIELGGSGNNTQTRTTTGTMIFGEADTQEQAMNDVSSTVYRIKSIGVVKNYDAETGMRGTTFTKEILDLKDGITINLEGFEDANELRVQERLNGDDMKHYYVLPERISVFNNSLIMISPSKKLLYDYNTLNAVIVEKKETSDQDYEKHYRVDVQYTIQGATEKLYVNAGPFWFTEECVNGVVIRQIPLTYQTFPDSRAVSMDVKLTVYYDSPDSEPISESYGTFPMTSHPFLDMAYHLAWKEGFFSLFGECDQHDPYEEMEGKNIEGKQGQIVVSEINNPFSFPVKNTHTFQSTVIGVAVATTALSQGQFGQFPLYVFTEDGIWAMETAADGSFITSKPLSRDVCINPESITAIDSAVVFVTDKGVMLLQGSQVVNISPNMNGRHYTIENTARTVIEGQEFFKDFIPVLTDSTHFMAYVREATIAYDYPGQRLVFIKKDEKYQYVYKLDTQTWHKVAYGIDLLAPVNSYPECLVQGVGEKETIRTFWKVSEYASQEEFDYLADRIRVKLPNLSDREIESFLDMDSGIEVTDVHEDDQEWLMNEMDYYHVATYFVENKETESFTRIYDLSTILDAAESRIPTRGVIATRPFDLGAPDVLKTITDIKIRGPYAKGGTRFMLLGSMDGVNFYVIGTKRGKAWKLFRLIILANIEPTERISWVDVVYEEKFTNRLR